MADVSIATIRMSLQERCDALVGQLVPGGRFEGGLYIAPNPTRSDAKAGSFKIWMHGAVAGKWVDFAGVNAPFTGGGDRGDIIDLIAYVACNRDRKKAIAWAKDWLGLATLPQKERDRLARLAHEAKLRAAAKHQDEHEAKIRRAAELFFRAKPGLVMTPAETYLFGRGIMLPDIPSLNTGDLRFLPALEYFLGATFEEINGRRVKSKPGPAFPALVCGFRDRHGAVTGVHCTYLASDGKAKAPVEKPKLMLGAIAGSVIRLTNGRGDLTPEEFKQEAVDCGEFVSTPDTLLCEGVEDGLSLAMAAPEARIWAAGSLGNLGNVYLDHACVRDWIIARDNDWQSPQAIKQFDHALSILEDHGKPGSVMNPITGKDFNDLLRM